MNTLLDTRNIEYQQIKEFFNQYPVLPPNSSLDIFMKHQLQWIPTLGLFDTKMLADLPLDTCQTYPMSVSSCIPWPPMTTADLPESGSMIDLNEPFLSHFSSSPLSYPSMSPPFDPNNELILPSLSDISPMWSPTHEQFLPSSLTPPPQLSNPTFIDASKITTTNPTYQSVSYHPSVQITPNTLQSAKFINPNIQPASLSNYPSKRSQSVSHPKNFHICGVDNCFKRFKRAEHLKRHQRCVHFDYRPYQCPISTCRKFFSRSDNLSAHLKIHQRSNSTLN